MAVSVTTLVILLLINLDLDLDCLGQTVGYPDKLQYNELVITR